MQGKPVVVSVKCYKPCVLAEVEPYADAIVVDFETQAQAVLDIISGKREPSGLLPMQFPKDMLTVEAQKEDVSRDMTPYTDADGNSYDFAFGLNWKGKISDWRTEKYKQRIINNGLYQPNPSGRIIRVYTQIDTRLMFGDLIARLQANAKK